MPLADRADSSFIGVVNLLVWAGSASALSVLMGMLLRVFRFGLVRSRTCHHDQDLPPVTDWLRNVWRFVRPNPQSDGNCCRAGFARGIQTFQRDLTTCCRKPGISCHRGRATGPMVKPKKRLHVQVPPA